MIFLCICINYRSNIIKIGKTELFNCLYFRMTINQSVLSKRFVLFRKVKMVAGDVTRRASITAPSMHRRPSARRGSLIKNPQSPSQVSAVLPIISYSNLTKLQNLFTTSLANCLATSVVKLTHLIFNACSLLKQKNCLRKLRRQVGHLFF